MADPKSPQPLDPPAAPRKSDPSAPEETPVYHLPNEATGNPGVQGFVFRPHQEKNPGETGAVAREPDALSQQIRSEKEARTRQSEKRRDLAQQRGEPWVEPPGPVRLRTHVDISAHAVVDEDKLDGIAQAADALVAALRDAGIEPKVNLFGQPL